MPSFESPYPLEIIDSKPSGNIHTIDFNKITQGVNKIKENERNNTEGELENATQLAAQLDINECVIRKDNLFDGILDFKMQEIHGFINNNPEYYVSGEDVEDQSNEALKLSQEEADIIKDKIKKRYLEAEVALECLIRVNSNDQENIRILANNDIKLANQSENENPKHGEQTKEQKIAMALNVIETTKIREKIYNGDIKKAINEINRKARQEIKIINKSTI